MFGDRMSNWNGRKSLYIGIGGVAVKLILAIVILGIGVKNYVEEIACFSFIMLCLTWYEEAKMKRVRAQVRL